MNKMKRYQLQHIFRGLLLAMSLVLLLATQTVSAGKDSASVTATRLPTVFGVAMNNISDAEGLKQLADAGTDWIRGAGVWWAKVEPTRGNRDWTALSNQEIELQNASARGMQVVVIVQGTPAWAQANPPYECGAIKRNRFPDFADFLHDLVRRYSAAPYNVKYYEIWNEPDIDPSLVSANSPFGCWGDQSDAYYGGGYYADILKAVYPKIKAANPQAQVLLGGLVLDCDPRNPPAGKDCKPSKFLEGVLRKDGDKAFDGISFHSYDYYYGSLGLFGNPNWNSISTATGPVGIAKARFIKSVLNKYGVKGKFLMNTESAILCDETGIIMCNDDYETSKAYYVTQVYAAAIAEGLRANVWFSAMGWRHSGFFNSDLRPRPAYTAFQFARDELRDSSFSGDIGSGDINPSSGIKGYKFNRGDRRIWLLWSLDRAEHSISLPAQPTAAWDALGNPISPSINMRVDVKPIYLEWNP